MLKQFSDTTGDGGYIIDNSDLPSWMTDNASRFSFMVWVYRKADAVGTFRNIFTLNTDASNYFGVRVSGTAGAPTLRADGTTYSYRQGGTGTSNLNVNTGEWSLWAGYIDLTGLNLDTKVWAIYETDDDPTAINASAWPTSVVPSADVNLNGELRVFTTFASLGAQVWHGAMGSLCFWDDIIIDEDDITTIWDAKNIHPWTQAASGNLPGPSHDGIFALPHFPGSNVGERGSSSNVEGPIITDVLTNPQDILTYRYETGVAKTDTIHVWEADTTIHTTTPVGFFDPYRENPS